LHLIIINDLSQQHNCAILKEDLLFARVENRCVLTIPEISAWSMKIPFKLLVLSNPHGGEDQAFVRE
jgi:hypothetical protein